MNLGFKIPKKGRSIFSRLARWCIGLIRALFPFARRTNFAVHVSGGEFNVAANLADAFGLQTAIATAMVRIRWAI